MCLCCNFDFEFHENQKSAFEIFIKTSAGQQPEGSNTKQRRRIFGGVTAVENFGKMHARNVKQILAEERRCNTFWYRVYNYRQWKLPLSHTKIKILYWQHRPTRRCKLITLHCLTFLLFSCTIANHRLQRDVEQKALYFWPLWLNVEKQVLKSTYQGTALTLHNKY